MSERAAALGHRQQELMDTLEGLQEHVSFMFARGNQRLFSSLEKRGLVKPASGECWGDDCGHPYLKCSETPCHRWGYALTESGWEHQRTVREAWKAVTS